MPRGIEAQELIDHIIDHCHDDRRTLCALSLVSRRWLPSARHHLFERVSVVVDLESAPGCRRTARSLASFATLVTSGSERSPFPVRMAVRSLRVQHGELADMAKVLGELPRLRKLQLCHLYVKSLGSWSDRTPLPTFDLEELEFTGCTADTAGDLFEFVQFYNSIRTLTIHDLVLRNKTSALRSSTYGTNAASKPCVKVFSLSYPGYYSGSFEEGATVTSLLGLLASQVKDRDLESLQFTVHISPTNPTLNPAFSTLVQAVSGNLRSLKLDVEALSRFRHDWTPVPFTKDTLDLSACKALRDVTLSLRLNLAYDRLFWADPFDILTPLTPSSISLTVNVILSHTIRSCPKAIMGSALKNVRWRKLSRMTKAWRCDWKRLEIRFGGCPIWEFSDAEREEVRAALEEHGITRYDFQCSCCLCISEKTYTGSPPYPSSMRAFLLSIP
ncbi:hypothetical protein BXZ70DRAFT_692539 [Cristinia sonorae]|uniref:F-box domain-containing protein n=1 Tax=Cristinia sonorae TaxID=1940300 RepID=A0A8K0XKE6_9AGAR|nr:hypothetical protein BXZ70DRAFT_692539 [Cristinia sonorae]